VLNNFYGKPCEIQLPDNVLNATTRQRLLISNYPDCQASTGTLVLRPYESFVLHLKD
jgi:trehalose-6-phosphate hydrolase